MLDLFTFQLPYHKKTINNPYTSWIFLPKLWRSEHIFKGKRIDLYKNNIKLCVMIIIIQSNIGQNSVQIEDQRYC